MIDITFLKMILNNKNTKKNWIRWFECLLTKSEKKIFFNKFSAYYIHIWLEKNIKEYSL